MSRNIDDLLTWVEDEEQQEARERDLQALSLFFNVELVEQLLNDGVRTIGHSGDILLLEDTVTGLPYNYQQGQLVLDQRRMLCPQYDIIDTCFYRQFLRSGDYPGKGKVMMSTLFTQSALDRYGLSSVDFLNQPIVDYSVRNKEELLQTVSHIQQRLSKGPYFRRLWFRGQRTEYILERNAEVCSLLGIGLSGQNVPSLLPSLGRFVRYEGGKVDRNFFFTGPNHSWIKPYIMWVIRNNSCWLSHYPEFMERLERSLRSDNALEFEKLLGEIRLDPNVPTEVDDLRQWFFAHFKFSTWVLVLQQYGYMTSMLDITWDLETSLFFTHTKMIDNRFEFVSPSQERVIYVFAESKESTSFVDSSQFDWGDEDWIRDMPTRINNQRCGALFGSMRTRQNLYGHLIVARIRLLEDSITSERKLEEMFPPAAEDLLYRTLSDAKPRPQGLY